jgi:hypothetical protein
MSQARDCPRVPVSWGELLDKITILQIKHRRLDQAEARANVARELSLLRHAAGPVMEAMEIEALIDRLQSVNEDLWEIEDGIRMQEAAADFGPRFVRLARSVYQKNDLRAAIKRQINELLGSALMEEKSYVFPGSADRPPAPAGGPQPAMAP